MIHAVVADDEVLARQKLRQLLRDDRDIEIVGESATALETIELAHCERVAVAVVQAEAIFDIGQAHAVAVRFLIHAGF